MKTIKWSSPARQDIERIREFSISYDPEIFPEIAVEIVAAARFIAESPHAAPLVGSTFVRKWRVKRFPFLIFFHLRDEEIWITRVRHAAEDWLSEFE